MDWGTWCRGDLFGVEPDAADRAVTSVPAAGHVVLFSLLIFKGSFEFLKAFFLFDIQI